MINVWITGAGGQLARTLLAHTPPHWRVLATSRAELDVTDQQALHRGFTEYRPHVLINAAAYTQVDGAETDPEAAFAVNAEAVRSLGRLAKQFETRLIHISTDYVFDGLAARPYLVGDSPAPLNVYGHSKLAGERAAVEETEGACVIVRTSALYAAQAKNFVTTMLGLMQRGEPVRVVCDQITAPTSTATLAAALVAAVGRPAVRGVLHCTDAGVASWYDLAQAIAELGQERGLVPAVSVVPVASSDFPRPAARPPFSVLDCFTSRDALGLCAVHWRKSLARVLDEIAARSA